MVGVIRRGKGWYSPRRESILFRNVFKVLSLLLIFGESVLIPIRTVEAQTTAGVEMYASQAVIDAESDAAAAADPLLWMVGTFVGTSLVGCLFCGLPAIGIAYIHQPSPPVARLMGKSPEYVMIYTQTYKEKIRSHQVMDATIGCVGGSLVAAFIWSRYYSGELGNYY